MTAPARVPRYGQRRIETMLRDWNALRAAVANRDYEAADTLISRCE